MELEKIYEIMSEFKKSGIGRMKIKDGDFSISLEMLISQNVKVYSEPVTVKNQINGDSARENIEEFEGDFIRSPIVGTFYEAPGTGLDPFVAVGKKVEKGATVCIVEAMKMMNEIVAPFDCIIEKLMCENEDAVGYDQPLFKIKVI